MDSENIKRQWLFENEKICICRGIPRKRFLEALQKGASSLQEINSVVGSGSGDCKGERCGPTIKKILEKYLASKQKQG